ncbi:MAG: hypothetical protein JWO86_412 [Myxococcaceae bacterium]|nr:hypothetical protein [Myxococcaceae bacterium]
MAAFLLLVSSMKTQIASIFAASLFVLGTAACHRNHARPAEGPVQRAGEHVDNAAEKTKDAAKDVAHDTKEGAKDIKNDVKHDVK